MKKIRIFIPKAVPKRRAPILPSKVVPNKKRNPPKHKKKDDEDDD